MLFGWSLVHPAADLVVGLLVAFVVGTFGEYMTHRFMHKGVVLVDEHRNHHLTNIAQGVFLEFFEYMRPVAVLMWSGFAFSGWGGVGGVLGSLLYALFAAYAHQVSHERPELLVWQRQPVHYIHHRYGQAGANFGIAVDWWDHLLGTYKFSDRWEAERPTAKLRLADFLDVSWREPDISKRARPLLKQYDVLPADLPEVKQLRAAVQSMHDASLARRQAA